MRMQQWAIEQENNRLQQEIEERNQLFKSKIKRKQDAAVKIQRAFRRYYRFKKFGMNTENLAQIIESEEKERGGERKNRPIISAQKIQKISIEKINFQNPFKIADSVGDESPLLGGTSSIRLNKTPRAIKLQGHNETSILRESLTFLSNNGRSSHLKNQSKTPRYLKFCFEDFMKNQIK